MNTGHALAVAGFGLVLAGCCGIERPRCPSPCGPVAAPIVVVESVPMPQPTPPAATDVMKAESDRRHAAVLAILDAKHVKGASFTGATVEQVATYLRTVTGVEFHVSPKAKSSAGEVRLVSMPVVADATVRQLLDVVVVPMGLVWSVRGDAVEIEVPGEAGAR